MRGQVQGNINVLILNELLLSSNYNILDLGGEKSDCVMLPKHTQVVGCPFLNISAIKSGQSLYRHHLVPPVRRPCVIRFVVALPNHQLRPL